MNKKLFLFSLMFVFFGVFVSAGVDAVECEKCWSANPDNKYHACTKDDDCKNMPGAKDARCILTGGKNTCAAIECAPGYMMWIYNGQSMGVCHKQSICRDKGYCPKECKDGCNPHYIDNLNSINSLVPNTKIQGKAYDYCSCGGFMCGDKDCKWVGSLAVACANGNNKVTVPYAIVDNVKQHASESEIKTAVMNKYQGAIEQACGVSFGGKVDVNTISIASTTVSGSLNTVNIQGVNLVVQENTAKQNNPVNGVDNIDMNDVNKAAERLSLFFKQVDSDRSVWKNADGSFNATRLASDLTAGVVLGTVGGVVSGVLIKKSQVEKGFDALNCTVGGQRVADWGDEFRVGLKR